MNSGPTAERVYDALKDYLITGNLRPGARLDPALLATPMASSVTPVRDALHRLTGEGLVETRIGAGFYMPAIDEPALKDRYDWSASVLTIVVRMARIGSLRTIPTWSDHKDAQAAERSGALFLALARRTGNGEHRLAVERLNDRMHAVRLAEPQILADIEAELEQLASALILTDYARVQRLIESYHRRRRRSAADIVRAMYRSE
ncbi:hypothetical protein BH10PSE12_BH10PSE12_37720 [soil metagenome]